MDPEILLSVLVRMIGPSLAGNTTIVCNSQDHKNFAMFSFNTHPELHLVNHVRHQTPEISLQFYDTDKFELGANDAGEILIQGPFALRGAIPRDKKIHFPMTMNESIVLSCYFAPR